MTPTLASRLPATGVTIFTRMSALAARHDAVNLGQGFPDFAADPRLVEAVAAAMRDGHNQYPPMAGVPALREIVARDALRLHGCRYDPESEVTITAGATQALLTALLCAVHPGDEVIVLEPCYDSYAPAIELAGGIVVRVPLGRGDGPARDFRPDFARLAAALGPRTRALVLNTPHNPGATVWTRQEMQRLADLLAPSDVLVIADEVYEFMVFDGECHVSASALPALAERAFVVSSFGKTCNVTGWKVGSVRAPAALSAEFRKVHQYNVFTVNTPMQHGLARYLADDAVVDAVAPLMQARRDRFRAGLRSCGLEPLPCEGSFFQCVDYRAVSDLEEDAFCRWLTSEIGVAAIPLSAFYADERNQHLARLCFAKQEATLDAALARLQALAR